MRHLNNDVGLWASVCVLALALLVSWCKWLFILSGVVLVILLIVSGIRGEALVETWDSFFDSGALQTQPADLESI